MVFKIHNSCVLGVLPRPPLEDSVALAMRVGLMNITLISGSPLFADQQ